jgi:hypothetical protein
MLTWLTRRTTRSTPAHRTRTPNPLRSLETLEARDVPAILIHIDYSRDTSGFFATNPVARATLEQAAAELGNGLNANLAAIVPSGGNTWTATFTDPVTDNRVSLANPTIPANTITVFVGARSLSGSTLAYTIGAGSRPSGSQAWQDTVETRNHNGYAPWGASLTFDSTVNWHFGSTTVGLSSNELDFYSVATHELGHVLGIGSSLEWDALLQGGYFYGPTAMSLYGGPVPVNAGGSHWAEGVTVNGQQVSLDPSMSSGRRVLFSALDSAALTDLGWQTVLPASISPSAPVSPTATVSFSLIAAGAVLVPLAGVNGVVTQYAVFNGFVFASAQFTPFPGYRGLFHQAHADFDSDGVLDVAVATVTPGLGAMTVISGLDGHYITAPRLTFGVVGMLATDIDGDGTSELATGEGFPLGIYVFDVRGGVMAPHTSFTAFGIPGRAAVEVDDSANSDGPDASALPPAVEALDENASASGDELAGVFSPLALRPEPDVTERPAFGIGRQGAADAPNDPFAQPAERSWRGSDLLPFDGDSFDALFVG